MDRREVGNFSRQPVHKPGGFAIRGLGSILPHVLCHDQVPGAVSGGISVWCHEIARVISQEVYS